MCQCTRFLIPPGIGSAKSKPLKLNIAHGIGCTEPFLSDHFSCQNFGSSNFFVFVLILLYDLLICRRDTVPGIGYSLHHRRALTEDEIDILKAKFHGLGPDLLVSL